MSAVADRLGFAYARRRVFEDLSFAVPAGMVCGVWGGNGAGKSTLLRVLAGVLTPDSGSFCMGGRTGFAPQEWGLYEELTVEENLEFFARAQGADWVGSDLERFGFALRGWQRAGELSHGWKQRLSLACAAVHRPGVLLLDEITAGLDAGAREAAWETIEAEAARGAAVLLTTHIAADAERCGMMLRLECPQ